MNLNNILGTRGKFKKSLKEMLRNFKGDFEQKLREIINSKKFEIFKGNLMKTRKKSI